MVQISAKTLTLEAFLQLPETKPASEYIDGQIIQKPMPGGEHSTIQGELVTTINAITKPQKIARALLELRCTFGRRSIVPDVTVFVWQRIPRDADGAVANVFLLAPDWTIEILSPDQRQTKVTRNILHCLKHGTQVGWLIDPKEQSILVYTPPNHVALFDEPGDTLPVPEFAAELQLTVGTVFGWLLE
ncbi:MAG: Uma2 family endonuclease [Tildeniella nuda ZEHNDER 1965/U140]|jgi:Uma2 family endonuclease|nr:Uma2 family endonuclease [Tildeniella nuda ZEHNDER 1965/U140]